ncbi:hypothetical protein [Lactobacillus phage Maenad]|uniref:Uncharacterized protein n=1 Tax=Lactobacillus phage Maenad TaxID=2079431 RepID=A0A2P0ZL12_9CAUD|nr:hypothetical protein HOS85_gp101 [Lactobacillus phage Maenad]AVH85680.1 hypothetical protein [Lactobacillus phage Maenad]
MKMKDKMTGNIAIEVTDDQVKFKSELDEQTTWGFIIVSLINLSKRLDLDEDELLEMVEYTWKEMEI